MYLTPDQFRAMDFGVNVADLSEAQLTARLRSASADVDSYCAVPLIPQKYSFAGGIVTGETHTWVIDPYSNRPNRRAFPTHTPLVSVETMRIHVTPDQYVEIDPDHVFYSQDEGWIEPFDAALTSYGLFGAGVLPFIGMTQPYVLLDYTYGYREPVSQWLVKDETADIWRASHGYWVADPTVHVDGVLRTTGMTFNQTLGTVEFTASPPAADAVVEIDVISSLPYDIAQATGMIAATKVSDRAWASKGFGGLRTVAVAEVRLERDGARTGSGTSSRSNIPTEAADKLEGYIFRTIR
jgi:hypothetical protein